MPTRFEGRKGDSLPGHWLVGDAAEVAAAAAAESSKGDARLETPEMLGEPALEGERRGADAPALQGDSEFGNPKVRRFASEG